MFILFWGYLVGLVVAAQCPNGYTMKCSPESGGETCCSCQLSGQDTCPAGYAVGVGSCSSGYIRKCLEVLRSKTECCACFLSKNARKVKGNMCPSGYDFGATGTVADCPSFKNYNVIFQCVKAKIGKGRCCKCLAIPAPPSEPVKEEKELKCPESYSSQLRTCPIIFGVKSNLVCINEQCCRCDFPKKEPLKKVKKKDKQKKDKKSKKKNENKKKTKPPTKQLKKKKSSSQEKDKKRKDQKSDDISAMFDIPTDDSFDYDEDFLESDHDVGDSDDDYSSTFGRRKKKRSASSRRKKRMKKRASNYGEKDQSNINIYPKKRKKRKKRRRRKRRK